MLRRDAILGLAPGTVASAQPLEEESLDDFQISVDLLEELAAEGEITITKRHLHSATKRKLFDFVLFRRREQL